MSDLQDLSFDDFDKWRRPPPTITDFDRVLATAMSRRGVLRAGVGAGATALALSGSAMVPLAAMASSRFAFEAVRASTLDTVTVPDGYQWDVLTRWGDPLWSDGAAFDQQSRGTAASQRRAVGDNNDGMGVFSKDGRHVLAVNNEYVNRDILHGNRADNKPVNADDVAKSKAAHGVSVMEIVPDGDGWAVQLDSDLNRRITADTPMQLTGPAAGHDLLKTAADPSGTKVLGTFNNCGYGQTPWGTYLTCEENFNGYFSASDDTFDVPDDFKRYGIGKKDRGYAWAMADERFDIAKHPNEPNRFGYVVEIDPLNPTSMPKKRTALGRFKHENAALVIAESGHVVVYLGDDERGEFLYKFVSRDRYQPAGDNAELLADGTLYVAKFNDDQTGRWIALTPETTGMASKAEICVHTRQAASAVGATTMDRPEWVAAHPMRAEAYVALTNNKNRGKKSNKGGDATPVGGPNPRAENNYGQIVRWRPADGDHTDVAFTWDIFVLAGNPVVHKDAYGGSKNINAENMFNSPDGLAFDSLGNLWIQTDGKYSNEGDFAGQGNNQMLQADPDTGEIRRFMVGPKECEITGLCWAPDKRTMFVGIQHPGEKGGSHFPDGGNSVPRSCIVQIRRDDGKVIG